MTSGRGVARLAPCDRRADVPLVGVGGLNLAGLSHAEDALLLKVVLRQSKLFLDGGTDNCADGRERRARRCLPCGLVNERRAPGTGGRYCRVRTGSAE